jgi:hypothetical protein
MSVMLAEAGDLVVAGRSFVCNTAVDIGTLSITNPGPTADAFVAATNCTGHIARLEISGGSMADGIKLQNASAAAVHDLTIDEAVVLLGAAGAGVHQDGLQGMGGRDVTVIDGVFDSLSHVGGGGLWFVGKAGSGATTPTRIVCSHCAFGPGHSNAVQVPTGSSVASGVTGSLVCRPRLGVFFRGGGDLGGNTTVEADDPRCTLEGLTAYAQGGTVPPPDPDTDPDPDPEPPPPDPTCDLPCVIAYEQTIDMLEQTIAERDATILAKDAQIAQLRAMLDEWASWYAEAPGD